MASRKCDAGWQRAGASNREQQAPGGAIGKFPKSCECTDMFAKSRDLRELQANYRSIGLGPFQILLGEGGGTHRLGCGGKQSHKDAPADSTLVRLLVTQRDHRIDAYSAPRWNHRRGDHCDQQERCAGDECDRVGSGDPKHQLIHHLA